MTQVGRAAETPDVAPESGAQPTGQQPGEARHWRYSLPGLAGALVFVCLSLSPSLLPRTGVIQGLVCGITAAIGYGVGVVAAWAWRAFADRVPRRTTHRSWRVFTVVSCVCLVTAMTFSRYWQGQIRMRMGVAPDSLSSLLVTPLLAALVFVALIASARTLRGLYRWTARRLERWIGPRAAHAVGWTAVVVGSGLLVSGVVLDSLVAAADEAFSVRNGATEPGVVQPVVPQRSGSAESLVPWTSLGRQGRNFTGTGPTPEQIAAFTGSMANMPIRAYAGLDSAATAEQRARLAVEDLARAGGFGRRTLVVVTTTGSGWVDPGAVDSVEYMTGGDSATVSMQYSYLPSWMSYLVDQERAREAGRALFDAVYDRWSRLPMDNRPRLVVVGESLGSFGGETVAAGRFGSATTRRRAFRPPIWLGTGLGCSTYNTPPTRSSGGAPDSSPTGRTGSTSHGATTSPPPCTGFLWSRSGRSARTSHSPPKFRPDTATYTPASTSTRGRTSSSPPAGRSTMPSSFERSSHHRADVHELTFIGHRVGV